MISSGSVLALIRRDGPSDFATGDVRVDFVGTVVDVDRIVAVDDLLKRHVDDRGAALDGDRGGGAGPFGFVPDGVIS